MAGWAPYRQREAALAAAEAQVAADPDAVEPRFARACLLDELGRAADAQAAYLEVLARAPGHLGTLCRLGNLLLATGRVDAAETAYREAINRHPQHPAAWVDLGNLLLERGDPAAARDRFEAALRLNGDLPEAHQGMARALDLLADPAAAERHRRAGYGARPLLTLPYRGSQPAVPVLLLASATGGNVPAHALLDPDVFLVSVLIAEYFDPQAPLPPHAVVFNAIGDADACGRALEVAAQLLQRTAAPAINPPSVVLATARSENARRLSRLAGVTTPPCVTLPRVVVDAAALRRLGLDFPLLVRAPGFHGGRFLLRVQRPAGLPPALARLPGDHVTATAFADTRSPDGWMRKYRVMMVDGGLYPAHLAIARDWMVHYATSETAARPELRAEEAAFLKDAAAAEASVGGGEGMQRALGAVAAAALRRVARATGLDYGGIDFALRPDGGVVVFEANATMIAEPPAHDPADPRRAAAERIRAAVRDMVRNRAGEPTQG